MERERERGREGWWLHRPGKVHGDLSDSLGGKPCSEEMELCKVPTQYTASVVVSRGLSGVLGEGENEG